MKTDILSTIGHTPIIELTRVIKPLNFRLFAKLEFFNPGGSLKDRSALSMITHAIERGEIDSSTVIIESSSGNMGIGLAQACAYFGLQFICVVDPKTTSQSLQIIRAYGAKVNMVTDPDATGGFLQARIDRVKSLLVSVGNSFWPNQYANRFNADAHQQTMREIVAALNDRIDYLFCTTSTCGTLRGCAEYIHQHNLRTRVIGVDALGSRIWGGPSGKLLIPGHGAAVTPKLLKPELADQVIHVSDLESIVGCRRLVQREAILAGGSSGATIMAVEQMRERISSDATCVVIFGDRGERYLDTIYSDPWVAANFGEVWHLWDASAETPLKPEQIHK